VLTAPALTNGAGATKDLSSPTLSADELEMFYSVGTANGTVQEAWNIYRSTRAAQSDMFGAGVAVPELDAACPGINRKDIALSADELSIYVMCEAADAAMILTGPVHRATRTGRGGAWTVDATDYGTVGCSPSITADQLTLVTGSIVTAGGTPMAFTRTSLSAPFANGTALAGLPALASPDIGADGSFVFAKQDSTLVLATRASAGSPFAIVNSDLLALVSLPIAVGGPAHSPNCSTLYYIQVDAAATTGEVWTIRAAKP
jgi:hypothetical protein